MGFVTLNLNLDVNQILVWILEGCKTLQNSDIKNLNSLKDKVTILIGSSGSGKTSFLHLILCFLGHNFNYENYLKSDVYQIIEKNKESLNPYRDSDFGENKIKKFFDIIKQKTIESFVDKKIEVDITKTVNSEVYILPFKEGNCYIMDTPGLNDPSGFDCDLDNLKSIMFCLENLLSNTNLLINNILYFYNSTNTKDLKIIQYVFDLYKSVLPRETNITFIGTYNNDGELFPGSTKFNESITLNNPLSCYKDSLRINYNHYTEEEIRLKKKLIKYNLKDSERKFLYIYFHVFLKNDIPSIEINTLITNYKNYRELVTKMKNVYDLSKKFEKDLSLLQKIKNKKTTITEDEEKLKLLQIELSKHITVENIYINVCFNCYENCGIYNAEVNLDNDSDNYFIFKFMLAYEGKIDDDSCLKCRCTKKIHSKCFPNGDVINILKEIRITNYKLKEGKKRKQRQIKGNIDK